MSLLNEPVYSEVEDDPELAAHHDYLLSQMTSHVTQEANRLHERHDDHAKQIDEVRGCLAAFTDLKETEQKRNEEFYKVAMDFFKNASPNPNPVPLASISVDLENSSPKQCAPDSKMKGSELKVSVVSNLPLLINMHCSPYNQQSILRSRSNQELPQTQSTNLEELELATLPMTKARTRTP